MKVWILGAAGQLGIALIDRCQCENIPFVASKKSDIDVTNLEAMKEFADKKKFTHVINCAAYTDVDSAEKNQRSAYAVNAEGPENIGIVARENGMHAIHVSTDYVFDGEKTDAYLETDQPNPLGVYGKSKWEGEERLFDQFQTACVVRTSWIFGYEGKNFISSLLSRLIGEEEIQAIEDQVNRATYSRDLASALLDLSCHSGLFHFANGEPLTRYQIAQDFYKEAKRRSIPLKCQTILPISSKTFPSLSPRPRASVLDTEKVTRTLGRKPRLWETILQEYFDYVAPQK